jgi:hypothetical protein
MRLIPSLLRAVACGLVTVALVGCGSSESKDSVPTTTDPNAPKLSPIGKEGGAGGESAPARTPEAEPLGVD